MSAQALTAAPFFDIADPPRERNPAVNAVINGIRCDPTNAERVYDSTGGGGNFAGDGFNRFDEVLYRNANGLFFLVRPLDPDEAQEWMEHPSHDHILARRLFPDDDDD